MKTPEEYKKLIENNIVTTGMLASVIYSLNKRAKNLREKKPLAYNKAKKIKNLQLMHYQTESDSSSEQKRVISYYKKKDYILLTLFKPAKIHIINNIEYLQYKIHNSEFHLPCKIYLLYGQKIPGNLEKVEITDFKPQGESINKLLSIQFCNKVIDCLIKGDFTIIDGDIIKIKPNQPNITF